jgi:hypothetical protein
MQGGIVFGYPRSPRIEDGLISVIEWRGSGNQRAYQDLTSPDDGGATSQRTRL